MITIRRNPAGTEMIYLKCLNTCFEQWGGPDRYRWYFHRTVGSHNADLMIFEKDGQAIAGSAVTYRQVLLANDARIQVGIMTGSWTLPAARRQGCFTRIIEESLALAAEKGVALLLAFVTEINASYRRLAEAGAALFPTYYLRSRADAPAPDSEAVIDIVQDRQRSVEIIADRLEADQAGHARVAYTPVEWQSQFLERPLRPEFLSINHTGLAVIEISGDSDHILFLSPHGATTFDVCLRALYKRAAAHGRQLMLFTNSLAWIDTCVQAGFGKMNGYLTALVADADALSQAIPGANRVPQDLSTVLSDPGNSGYIGPWSIQSGDRM